MRPLIRCVASVGVTLPLLAFGAMSQLAGGAPAGVDLPTPVVECRGQVATIVGTSRGDVIDGTGGADVIYAGAGADIVDGHRGNDVICGGNGGDFLQGGRGADRLFGQADGPCRGCTEATVYANGDTLDGGPGADLLSGGGGTGGPGDWVEVATPSATSPPRVASRCH